MSLEWRIYYDDGSTYSDADGQPEDAPSFGVIAVVCYDEAGERMVMQKWNYYYAKDLDDGRPIWYGSDLIGLIDQLAHDSCRAVHGVKIGRTVPNDVFESIIIRACNDHNFVETTRKIFRSQPREVK